MKIDPITLNIIGQGITAIPKEMGTNLIRTAYSTIIREAQDASTAILDIKGNLIAQAELITTHIGGLPIALKNFLKKFDIDKITDDDIFITNDPYHGGQHPPDILVFTPIFFDGQLVAFTGSSAHYLDLGGGAAGINVGASDIHQEAVIIPPIKISAKRDYKPGGMFYDILVANTRLPQSTIGDFNAQLTASRTGEKRFQELIRKYGVDLVLNCMDAMIDYSETLTRNAIKALPDGEYEAEDFLEYDNDCEPLKIKVKITIKDSDMHLDFSETDPQMPGSSNAPIASTIASVNGCIRSVIHDLSLPFNDGCTRPIHINIPHGCLLNPIRPASVRLRMSAVYRAYDAVMKALAKVCPERVVAAGADTCTAVALSYFSENDQRQQVFIDVLGGGNGAGMNNDGASGIDSPLTNCSNIPCEAIEHDYDYFNVISYTLVENSGGKGKHNGGLGIERRYKILKDQVRFTGYSDRFRIKPWGLFGGEDGSNGSFSLFRNGEEAQLNVLESKVLYKDDILIVTTPGGGGYGTPENN